MNKILNNAAVSIYPDPETLGKKTAELILSRIEKNSRKKQYFLMICPSGRSAMTSYQALGALAAERNSDLSGLVIVMMDEYIHRNRETYSICPETAHYSGLRFANEEIRRICNNGLPENRKIKKENIWIPDLEDPAGYDRKIRMAGGADLSILASGASDGHVAFNAPPADLDTETRIIRLSESTRRDNMATFPEFKDISEVPEYGIGIGLRTITELSRETVLIVHGIQKKYAVQRLLDYQDFDPAWPVSVIYRCPNAQIFLDEAAFG